MTDAAAYEPVRCDQRLGRSRASAFRWLPWLLAAVLLANVGVGILPFASFEGDDQAIVTGLHERLLGDRGVPGLGYTYDLQAGTYEIVVLLHHVLRVDVGALFYAISALSAVGFIVLTACLGSELFGIALSWMLVAAALAQENIVAAAYGNTSTVGGFMVLLGICFLARWPGRTAAWLASACCIAIGGWCRTDALVLAPLVLIVFGRDSRFRSAVGKTAAVAGVTLTVLLVLLYTSGTSPRAIWTIFQGKGVTRTVSHAFGWLYLLHSATGLLLAGLGVIWATLRREYLLTSAVLVVFLPLFAIHGRSLDTTKYFYYGVPLLVWGSTWTIAQLIRLARAPLPRQWCGRVAVAMVCSACVAITLEYVTGVRREPNEVRRWTWSNGIRIATVNLARGESLVWSIGPGDAIGAGDGFRLRGGFAFTPWLWRFEKDRGLKERARLDGWLRGHRDATIITSSYFAQQVVVALLRGQGMRPVATSRPYPLNPSTERALWSDGTREIEATNVNLTKYRMAEFRDVAAHATRAPVLFANDIGRRYALPLMRADDRSWAPLSPDENAILALYERQ